MRLLALALFVEVLATSCIYSAGELQRDPISHETAIRQARPRALGEKFDSQENDSRLRDVFVAADAEAERAVGNVPRDKHFIFRFWSAKKKILRQKHSIDWKTPAELNPRIMYDSYGQPALTSREVSEISAMIRRELPNKGEKIVSIERTLDGTINVWTTLGNTADRGKYVITKVASKWKIVDREVP
jgi:hypothetical protein